MLEKKTSFLISLDPSSLLGFMREAVMKPRKNLQTRIGTRTSGSRTNMSPEILLENHEIGTVPQASMFRLDIWNLTKVGTAWHIEPLLYRPKS